MSVPRAAFESTAASVALALPSIDIDNFLSLIHI